MVYDDIIFEESTSVKVNWGVSLKMNITKDLRIHHNRVVSEGQTFQKLLLHPCREKSENGVLRNTISLAHDTKSFGLNLKMCVYFILRDNSILFFH
ncbi:unnamed protein product [Rhizophagus irregularis]|uniref:uncharacterized protein n=1 Tax=Rhizophagus irregularis TaxID=588596 RepID=UPI0019F582EE|nr:hypothetical protein OCT59_013241 [Rhizophagus irregularis]GET53669.1 hypothetical protein RIR_jg3329.t1 [Rhizophagus irregularis DAOM 181602=DAOM 197198]CAB4434508.1 unnamed protein product [Rhizophagus irregularis]